METMKNPLFLLTTMFLMTGAFANAAPLVDAEFGSERLDWQTWCPCQIDMEHAPVQFLLDEGDGSDQFARIPVYQSQVGGNKCRSYRPYLECRLPDGTIDPAMQALNKAQSEDVVPDLEEPFGPSVIGLSRGQPDLDIVPDSYCDDEIVLKAHRAREEDRCIQRQELRFQKDKRHDFTEPYVYSIRFRMPAVIEKRTGSIRWVIGQWKQTTIDKEKYIKFGDEWGPSPYLAQRFDNGVLHVTVQDEHCRCNVASAPHADGYNPEWRDGRAVYCRSTDPFESGRTCTPNLFVKYGSNPILTSPIGEWVELRYEIQAGPNGRINIYEGDRHIVEVTGNIGHRPAPNERALTKFKIGHYRDFMPFDHYMDVDWVKVEPLVK